MYKAYEYMLANLFTFVLIYFAVAEKFDDSCDT